MKYTIVMGCGHEDTIDLIGKNSDRERKIEYFKSYGLCKECYKKKMEEDAKNSPFTFNFTVLPYINEENGNILLNAWFDGNTKPYKDDIKSLGGYRWSEREAANDCISTSRPPLCWNKIIELDDLLNEIQKAKSIGAENFTSEEGLFAMANYQIAIKKHKKWEEKCSKLSEIVKPATPEILKDHKWNQKIYGKAGNSSVYLDGEKVMITDEQASEIKEYLRLKEEFKKKVEEIKNA